MNGVVDSEMDYKPLNISSCHMIRRDKSLTFVFLGKGGSSSHRRCILILSRPSSRMGK